MSAEVIIGRRFTIVIPKAIREKLHIKVGQRAMMRYEGGRILIELLPDDPHRALSEALGDFSYSEEEHEKGAEEWLREVARAGH
ncbi:MAG: AbrB/MazE/SpoVT family DNA-binding domain-containing protein [Candidatus Bathyarchaeia archaeon]